MLEHGPDARGDATRIETLPSPADLPTIVILDRSLLKETMFNCTQHNGACWVEQAVGADDIADLDRGDGVIVVALVDAGTLYGFRPSPGSARRVRRTGASRS